jgi:hypothetical protein
VAAVHPHPRIIGETKSYSSAAQKVQQKLKTDINPTISDIQGDVAGFYSEIPLGTFYTDDMGQLDESNGTLRSFT